MSFVLLGHGTDRTTKNEILQSDLFPTEGFLTVILSAWWNNGANWMTVEYRSRCPRVIANRVVKRNASKSSLKTMQTACGILGNGHSRQNHLVQFCLERLWESSSISPVFKLYFQKQIQALCVIYVGHEFLLSYMLHRNDCALKRNDDWWSHSCIAGHHSSRFSMCTVVNCLCKSFCLNDSLYTIEIYSLDYLVKIINLWKLKHSFIY
jgi:hypothetical protein